MNKRKTGSIYEDMAAAYLGSHGISIISRNFRSRYGEIDIVARQGKDLIFVEVKYRSGSGAGNPLESITPHKVKQIRNAALSYMRFMNYNPETMNIRFDCIGILGTEVNHVENAF